MRPRHALLAFTLALPLPALTEEPQAEANTAEYVEWESEAEDREDSTGARPTIHPGPEIAREPESGLTASGAVVGFLQGFLEVLCALGNVTRILL